MLKRLTIRNFQRHKKLDIWFSRITCFVGETDAGKSAILRALRWVLQNRPSGVEFIRHGSVSASATLTIDRRQVQRKRGKTNRYYLDGQKFAAFGNSVPGSIANIARVSDLNFQDQHDPAYWLAEAPAQVSRQLNQIVNLGVIDSSLSNAAAAVRRLRTETELTAARLKQAKQARDRLAWVPEFESRLVNLEKWERSLELQRSTIDDIASALEKVQSAEDTLKRSSPLILGGLAAVKAGERAAKLQKRLEAMESMLIEIERTETECQELKQNAETQQRKLSSARCPLCGRLNRNTGRSKRSRRQTGTCH